MTTTPTSKTTTPTSNFTLLDPSVPAGLQAQARNFEKIYERYMPELSAVADHVFKDHTLRLKAKEARAVSIWVPGQRTDQTQALEIPKAAAIDAYGTPVPESDVAPKAKISVRTPALDPRLPPFNGDPELMAVHLGQTLAKHVQSEIVRLESETGKKLQSWFGDVEVIGELPSAAYEDPKAMVNGLRLSPTCPMLYARMFVHLRQR